MEHSAYAKMAALASTPEALEESAAYIASHLRLFLRPRCKVLICFPAKEAADLGSIFVRAVQLAEAYPLVWGPDHRWKTLLRQAFSERAEAVIGPPLVILGMSKLAKATATPLYIRNAVTAGYPCEDWMIDGIIRGLDCNTWGCFGPGIGPIVSGFSCGRSRGVHIREDVYDVTVEGAEGAISVSLKSAPRLRLPISDHGRMVADRCPCGRCNTRLMDIAPAERLGAELDDLMQELHSWTSILDVRLERGESGLEMELVVFPGQKLPKLPTCAKRLIRAWNPEEDEPFGLIPDWERHGI